jgi:hypothetical protein
VDEEVREAVAEEADAVEDDRLAFQEAGASQRTVAEEEEAPARIIITAVARTRRSLSSHPRILTLPSRRSFSPTTWSRTVPP